MPPPKTDFPRSSDRTQIPLRIPHSYHQEPIISQLIAKHGLTVNISAASLGGNSQVDGWFNLELIGKDSQIGSALVYLRELDLEFW